MEINNITQAKVPNVKKYTMNINMSQRNKE